MKMNKFKVKYKCLNCSYEFSEGYTKGDRIVEHWDCIYLEANECTHGIGCNACRSIMCPNCDSKKDIKIVSRSALEKDNGI